MPRKEKKLKNNVTIIKFEPFFLVKEKGKNNI